MTYWAILTSTKHAELRAILGDQNYLPVQHPNPIPYTHDDGSVEDGYTISVKRLTGDQQNALAARVAQHYSISTSAAMAKIFESGVHLAAEHVIIITENPQVQSSLMDLPKEDWRKYD